MNWNPSIDVDGDREVVRVSASDIEQQENRTSASDADRIVGCGRYLALKVHNRARAQGWNRLYPPPEAPETFVLRIIREIIRALGSPITAPHEEIRSTIEAEMKRRRVIRQLHPYIEHAVFNIVDTHDSLESSVGRMRLVAVNPEIGPPGRQLTVWADCYDSEGGTRQVHRLRMASAKPSSQTGVDPWSATAARIAAELPNRTAPLRIQVVEIGLVDGSTSVTFDGDITSALDTYRTTAQTRAQELCETDDVNPCRSCGDCKAAGNCAALTTVDGFLGQSNRGFKSRSLSPTDLRNYSTCPAKWLMLDSSLPRDRSDSAAVNRGRVVHEWLKAAHLRGIACTGDDLPLPGGSTTVGDTTFPADQYAAARPFLMHHVANCPLAMEGAHVLSIEESLRGYDHDAEVITAIAPDVVYLNGSALVLREVKTAETAPASHEEAFDKHLQVPFALRLLASGLAEKYGLDHGIAELEVLTVDGAKVWSWDTSDAVIMTLAASQVEMIAQDWHTDFTWLTKPSRACDWCEVRRWCPDRDKWANSRPSPETQIATSTSTTATMSPPPF